MTRQVPQQSFVFRKHGGPRRGAGRPKKQGRASERHEAREKFAARYPVHVTLRTVKALGNLRRRRAYHAVRWAMYCVIGRHDFRIVHISIQHDHIHLIVEADGAVALAKGMQAFLISAAQRLNRALEKHAGVERRGTVFPDRYHARVLRSPTTVRNALAYVLNNWRKHREDRGHAARKVDPYSSGINFGGWLERRDVPVLYEPPDGFSRLSTSLPLTWLLRAGWEKAGAISVFTTPGAL